MSYRILTHNGIENTNIDGARNYNFNTNGKSGVLKGFLSECDLSINGKKIVIASGELRLAGHRIVIDDSETFSILSTPSSLTKYSLIAKIVVTKTQPEFSIEVRVNPITLIQDNLHLSIDGNGTYEIELGTFEVDTSGNILNLTKTVDLLEISSGSGLTEEEKAKLDTIKTDGNGDRYLADDGTYKEVESITVDSETSLESENPVQNKVITEALNSKLNRPTEDNMGIGSSLHLLGVERRNLDKDIWCASNNIYIFAANNNVHGTVVPVIPQYKIAGKPFTNDGAKKGTVKNTIYVCDPELDYEATPKKWVEDNTTRLYKHTKTISLVPSNEEYADYMIDFEINCISDTTNSIIDLSTPVPDEEPIEMQLQELKAIIPYDILGGQAGHLVLQPYAYETWGNSAIEGHLNGSIQDFIQTESYDFTDILRNWINTLKEYVGEFSRFSISDEVIIGV